MELVKKHSQFINFPIYVWTNTSTTKEVPIEEEEDSKNTDKSEDKQSSDTLKVEDAEDEEKEKQKTRSITVYDAKYVLVNSVKPIWTRSPSDITTKEYSDFYKAITKDSKDPSATIHFSSGTGTTDFKSLVFVPSTSSFNPFSKDEPSKFLTLYIKGVMITDEFKEFPRFLAFIKAIVDADDIPLNVSREMLQKHQVMKIISNRIVSKVLSHLADMSQNDEVKYNEIYGKYANHLKLGVMTEQKNKDAIISLLRFRSSFSDKNLTSLDQYVERMALKTNQTEIYFVTGGSISEIRGLPYVERILKRGYEVLFLEDLFDDQVTQTIFKYKEFTLRNLAKAGTTLGDETESEKKTRESDADRYKPLIDYLQKKFSATIEKVTISTLLEDSPMAIVASAFGYSPQMERAAKGYKDDFMASFMLKQKKIIEINPNHPLMESLLKKMGTDSVSIELGEDVQLLYDAALLHSGYELKNPALFAHRVEDMIRAKYGLDRLPEESMKQQVDEDDKAGNPLDFLKSAGGDFPNFNPSDMMNDDDMHADDDFMGKEPEAHHSDDKVEEVEKDEL